MENKTMLKCSDAYGFMKQAQNRMLKELKMALQLHYREVYLEYSWENEYYGNDEAFYENAPIITVVPPGTSTPCNIYVAKVWLDQDLKVNVSGYMVDEMPVEVSVKEDRLDPCDIQYIIGSIPATDENYTDMSVYSTCVPLFEVDYLEALQEMTIVSFPILTFAAQMSHADAFNRARKYTADFLEKYSGTCFLSENVKQFISDKIKMNINS